MADPRLDEISLINFSKKQLASDQTVKFSKERQGFEGQAPKSTKFIQLDINDARDEVNFYFLTAATEKYGDDHQYKDTNPSIDFRLERDPSATYEIQLRFFGLSKVKNNPDRKLDDVKNWLWSTDFAVWSNDPSFHWQGHNWAMSRLGASIHPTNIAPTHKHIGPNGRTVMGWKDVHNGSFLSKHLFDLFLHIRFFINIMAGALMKKLSGSTRERPPRPNKFNTSPSPTRDITGKKFPHLKPDPPEEAAPEPEEEILAPDEGQPEVPQEPAQPTPEEKNVDEGEEGGVDAEVTKPKEKSMKNSKYRWVETTFGPEVRFTRDYKMLFETESSLLSTTLMDYQESKDLFSFEAFQNLSWKERQRAYEEALKMTEVSVYFNFGLHEEKIQGGPIRAHVSTLREYFLEVNQPQILTFVTSPLVSESHSKLTSRMIEEFLAFFPNKVDVIMDSYEEGTVRHFLMDAEVRAKIFPQVLQEAEQDAVVCAVGTFTPPTKNHLRLLQKVLAGAQQSGAANLLFLMPDRDFAGDAGSLKQKQSTLRHFPQLKGLNICADPGVTSLYAAMMYLYTDLHYKTVTLICGADQVVEMEAFFTDNNGKKTKDGFFHFDQFKVVSFGAPNPDKDQEAQKARNALNDGDFEKFMKASEMPYFGQMKNLFSILKYELKSALGMSGV